MEITYKKVGDYYIPNLVTIQNKSNLEIGKYGRARLKYLKENKKAKYIILKMNNGLENHLLEINKLANERVNFLIKQQSRMKNIDENLKEKDELKWIQMMNNLKNSAEEIVFKEIIYG